MIRTMGGFLNRLRANTAGNTLAIVGAALVPITAMIGSGLDVSRAYMAKSRMQSACDAASLAARRVMRNDNLSEDVIATGAQFFNFNFSPGMYSTAEFEPEITKPEVGIVRVEASTRIPTTVMRLFGFDSLPLNVTCDASLNFVNTDVVLVLDVTGSMDDSVGGTKKIVALRDAVMALYDELAPVQAQLESQGLRLRYGIVPYSSTVNVGRLIYDVDSSYMRANAPYQTRLANFSSTYNQLTSNSSQTTETQYLSNSTQCDRYAGNRSYPTLDGAGPFVISGSLESGTQVTRTYSKRDWRSSDGRCRRYVTNTTRTYTNFSNWTYKEDQLDTSNFLQSGGHITLASSAPSTASPGSYDPQEMASATGSGTQYSWNGCIEERDTVTSITSSSGFSIPSGANDLDINLIPEDDASRWRPMLAGAVYRRASGSTVSNPEWNPSSGSVGRTSTTQWQMNYAESQGYYACPYEAERLKEWDRDDLEDYVGDLTPIGGTYHDIGMIWGARLISTGGIFADGCEEFNGMPCNRHVIFMTDGMQTAYCNVYSAYGVERNDKRVGGYDDCTSDAYNASTGVPTDSTTRNLLAKHAQRFRMICNATKNMNVSVWVIAFDTGLTTNLTECASNSSQAQTSTNRDELITQFRQIGNQIGALRLTK